MLQNPENRKRSHMPQPTPDGLKQPTAIKEKVDPFQPTEISAEDAAMIAEMDKRMAAKKSGSVVKPQLNEMEKINDRLNTIEQTLMEIMKTHIKLIKRL